jgi:hypothetical protein
MNIIIENNTKLVIWNGEEKPFVSENVFKLNNASLGISSNIHTLIENVILPNNFSLNTYTYINEEFEIANQQNYNVYVNSYNNKQKELRAEAYRNESDPLFFKAQRQEIPMQEWLDKVSAIKAKYSYIE